MKSKRVLTILSVVFLLALVIVLMMLPEPAAKYVTLFEPALIAVIGAAVFINTGSAVLLGVLIPAGVYLIFWNEPFVPFYLIMLLSLLVTGLAAGLVYDYMNASLPAALIGVLSGCIVTTVAEVIFHYVNDLPYAFSDCIKELVLSRWAALIVSAALIPFFHWLICKKEKDRVK